MTTKRREIARIATNRENTFITVAVRYDLGNVSFSRVRGYYLHLNVEEITDEMRCCLIGRGAFGLLESATRFVQQRMDACCESALYSSIGAQCIVRLLAKNPGMECEWFRTAINA